MNMKKLLSCTAAAALALSLTAVPSYAIGTDVVDFEDGDCSFVYMNVDSGADESVISVEDYDGSKQLKIDVQDHTLVPKVWFDMKKMMDVSNYVNINSIEFDLTLVPKNDGEMIGWAGGAIGASGKYGDQVDPAWSQGDWSCEDENLYVEGQPAKVHCVRKFLLPSQKFTETSESPFFGLMRWAGETDYVMYFDNIVFYDKDGNTLPLLGGGAAPAAEEAAPAAEEAPAEEAAPAADPVPASDNTTTAAATGNASAAAIAALMAMAGAAAVLTKKKN